MPFVLGAASEDKPLQLMMSKPWCTLLTSLLLQFWSITYRPTSFNFIGLDPAVHAGDMSRFARSCEICKKMETLSDQWKAVKEGSWEDPSFKCRAGRKWTLGLLHKMVLLRTTAVTPLREPTALADALHECLYQVDPAGQPKCLYGEKLAGIGEWPAIKLKGNPARGVSLLVEPNGSLRSVRKCMKSWFAQYSSGRWVTFLSWASFHHVIGAKTYCIFNGLVAVAIVTSGSLSNDDGDINENCLRAKG